MTDTNPAAAPEYLDDYSQAAAHVADVIGDRDGTHGDPEAFGATFAAMLTAYLIPVFARAGRLGPADSFAVLDLMKSARIACGGPHPAHFVDKAGYGLLGLVHTQRAFAMIEAHQARETARQEAEARTPTAPEPEAPRVAPEDVRAARKPAPELRDEPDEDDLLPELPEDTGPRNWTRPAVRAEGDDPVDDIDLLRWSLEPGASPFADLLQEVDGVLAARPGVTAEQLRARKARVLDLLRNHVETTDEGANRLAAAIDRYSKLAA